LKSAVAGRIIEPELKIVDSDVPTRVLDISCDLERG